MAMQSYDFKNKETFHCYEWAKKSGRVQKLIAIASEREEQSVIAAREVHRNLVSALETMVSISMPERTQQSGTKGECDQALWYPLLEIAANSIRYDIVARALLVEAGWNLDPEAN